MPNPYRPAVLLPSLLLVLATPVAVWWLVGDVTSGDARRLAAEGVALDHTVRPVSLGATGDRIVGVLACVAAAVALGVLVRGTVVRRLDARWWAVLAPLVVAGALVGYAARVLTAGVIGANIGAGLIVLVGGPVLAVLLVVAAVAAWRLRPR
ncbi:hypothetical protein [Micromonospora thermarum]|uniref:Uncharacterized protein n=1 Tax=Micromonospora thermarum TaxID=2720024 RepID=A0ABX0ZDE0_9ACTN|nr:hypothetical protein [Micromonospora thermarum]NJP34519.1 hypothetical protein [Micromonospora thermarum]